MWGLPAGYEKKLRLYDLDKMDAEPFVIEGAPDKIRCIAWHQDDNLLLTSYIDNPGIGCVHEVHCLTLPQHEFQRFLLNYMQQDLLPSPYPHWVQQCTPAGLVDKCSSM